AIKQELSRKLDRTATDDEALSYVLYPQVYTDFAKHQQQYSDISVIPTWAFFYGLQAGEEISIELEPGKILLVKFLTVSDPHDDKVADVLVKPGSIIAARDLLVVLE